MKIPFLDLKRIHEPLRDEIISSFSEIYDKGDFILGKVVEEFEQEFAKYCGVEYAIGVDNGLNALQLILKSYNIKGGDEVITVANTFNATVSAIANVGATPVLVDIKKDYNIDVEQIKKEINSKTRAIMPVHLYGQICDMNKIINIAKKNNLIVIEDACQAHGAKYNEKRAGNLGDAAAFSFYPGKNLGALGDGGMITTKNEEIMKKIKMLRNYGQSKKYYHDFIGINSRLDSLQAAALKTKLAHLDKWNDDRKKIASKYIESLKNLVSIPITYSARDHIYHLFVIRTKERDKLMDYLKQNEIDCGLHYPIPIHLQDAFSFLGYKEGDFPETESSSKEILSLPIFPCMTEEESDYVISQIKNFFNASLK